MTDDRTLDYHILKNLQYQNEYSHFIYRNTNKVAMQQRIGNFWRIIEIPSILLTLINLFIIFYTNNLIIGGLFTLFTILGVCIIGYFLYNYYIKKQNLREENLIDFNSILIWIQNSKDQIEIINKYNINGMDAIKLSKIQEIEDLIEDYLSKAFINFSGQTINEIGNFLKELTLNPSRLKERLERIKTFMEENSENYNEKTYFSRLNIMIQYLNALENKKDDFNRIIKGLSGE